MRRTIAFALLGVGLALPANLGGAEPKSLVAKIQAVGSEGKGNTDAAQSWKALVKLGPSALLEVLTGLDTADPTAANWLRAAVDAIAERELAAKRPLPIEQLEAFIRDVKHAGAARRLAYEWLVRADPKAADRLLPGMLEDPGVELRRDAVARVVKEADEQFAKDAKDAALKTYQKALASGRDRDQVDHIAGQLKKLGQTVDLPAHFGFIQRWLVIGPFDSSGGVGFKAVYPPEKQVDLNATYPGKGGMVVGWKEATAEQVKDNYALIDFNKVLTKYQGAAAYAFAAVESPKEQPVEIRASSNNAVKLFLNGKEVFFREEYHHGVRFDGMIGKGTLKQGRNEIVVKVCQNEQKEDWAQTWGFQVRLSDAIGGAIPFKVLPEKPAAEKEKQ
ncbi:MAG: hypothetical protein JNM56_34140 [Planctomycetia bacterium]|nr:hypothetical protein [Planctomycetia bacterium]